MLLRRAPQRAGLNLIELLVVIAIIAVLMSLLMAGVMRVLDAGPRTETTARQTAISNAIGAFTAERQVKFIPAGEVDNNPSSPTYGQANRPFRLQRSYIGPSEYWFEAQYIKQVFPNANLADLGDGLPNNGAQLDANQTLLFFLNGIWDTDGQGGYAFRGFSRNPQRPFDRGTAGEERIKPLLDVSNKHVMAAPNGYPWLKDAWDRPMAYFSAFNGKAGKYGGYHAFPATMGAPRAYTNGGKYEKESGFQIISAGKDGVFGSGDWNNVGPAGEDDRANFSTNNLGGGPK